MILTKYKEFPDYIDCMADIRITGSNSGGLHHYPPACDSAMNRLFIVLAFVSLVGCRMCGSPYDYCVPAHTSRTDDYRDCDVFYRAGSIFWNNDAGCAEYDGMDVDFVADRSVNAGNFGKTTPIESKRPTLRTLEPKKLDKPSIGIPSKSAAPSPNGTLPEEFRPFEQQVPSSPNLPISPPPTVPPSLTPMPFDQTRNQGGPPITIEELRRLDPSVTDIRILNVEDAPSSKIGAQVP